MGIQLSSTFDMNSALPLDSRTVVADITARNAIVSGKRFQGLIVYVTADQTTYQLQGGITNSNWVEFGAGGGGVLSVVDVTARNAIVAGDRYDGLIVYVQSSSINYQLQGGILDANWVEIGAAGNSGIIIVANTTARDAIIVGDRYDGLIVYVLDIKQNYQLQGGISNADWVLLASVNTSAIPLGSVTAFAGSKLLIPTGFLYCDGTPISRTTFASLFDVIGTSYGDGSTLADGTASGFSGTHFNVPDLRGVFLRGVSDLVSTDPDRTSRTALRAGAAVGNNVGSYQGSAFESHSHQQYTSIANGGSTMSVGATNRGSSTASAENTGNSGGNETRPKNVYVNYMIRAFSAAVPATTEGSYGSVVAINTTSSISPTDGVILIDCTAGAVTANLPTASNLQNKVYVFKKVDSTANAATIDAFGSELIDTATTYVLTDENYSIKMVSNGAKWFII